MRVFHYDVLYNQAHSLPNLNSTSISPAWRRYNQLFDSSIFPTINMVYTACIQLVKTHCNSRCFSCMFLWLAIQRSVVQCISLTVYPLFYCLAALDRPGHAEWNTWPHSGWTSTNRISIWQFQIHHSIAHLSGFASLINAFKQAHHLSKGMVLGWEVWPPHKRWFAWSFNTKVIQKLIVEIHPAHCLIIWVMLIAGLHTTVQHCFSSGW